MIKTIYQLEMLGIIRNDGDNITVSNGDVYTIIDTLKYTKVS